MTSGTSFQLPDLLNLTSEFELRTNRWCHSVTTASERWLLGECSETTSFTPNNNSLSYSNSTPILDVTNERETLRGTKIGLLAALCLPMCDAPQLRLITDFLTLLHYSNARLFHSSGLGCLGWSNELEHETGNDIGGDSVEEEMGGVVLLEKHALFKHIAPQIRRLASRASHTWRTKFTSSVRSFKSAQETVLEHRNEGHLPGLEEYVVIRREVGGLRMVFDMIVLVEAFPVPIFGGENDEQRVAVTGLCHAVLDVIAWSLDILSYNLDQAKGNSYNLITVLMRGKNLSVQGAVNYAGNMIKEAFGMFLYNAQRLRTKRSSTYHNMLNLVYDSLTWLWPSVNGEPNSVSDSLSVDGNEREIGKAPGDVEGYILGLKDCIVGTLNWAYETELYFGLKGEEIRTFGWVFLN